MYESERLRLQHLRAALRRRGIRLYRQQGGFYVSDRSGGCCFDSLEEVETLLTLAGLDVKIFYADNIINNK